MCSVTRAGTFQVSPGYGQVFVSEWVHVTNSDAEGWRPLKALGRKRSGII